MHECIAKKNEFNLSGKKMQMCEKWTSHTNLKAVLSNAGQPESLHPNFVPFTVSEMQKLIGLHVFQGVSQSPHVALKFRS